MAIVVIHPEIIDPTNKVGNKTLLYYDLLNRMLEEHQFTNPKNRLVLELHLQGLSLRKIAKELEAKGFPLIRHTSIRKIILREIKRFSKAKGANQVGSQC